VDSPSADRFSLVGGVLVAGFGFFFTTTPFSDFLMSIFVGTVLLLALSELAGLVVGIDADNGGGLLIAFSCAATAFLKSITSTPSFSLR